MEIDAQTEEIEAIKRRQQDRDNNIRTLKKKLVEIKAQLASLLAPDDIKAQLVWTSHHHYHHLSLSSSHPYFITSNTIITITVTITVNGGF